MKYKVIPTDLFLKEAKRLKKKFNSIPGDILKLADTLAIKPESGTPLGGELFKIRLAIKSKGKGKSGGARVITYLVNENQEVYLLSIYDKSELEMLPLNYLRQLAEEVRREI